MGCLLDGSGSLFSGLRTDQEFVRNVKKCCLGVFLGEKSTRLVLQKHANRTVHPSKIEDVLPMVQRLRIAIFGGSRCPEKKSIFFWPICLSIGGGQPWVESVA